MSVGQAQAIRTACDRGFTNSSSVILLPVWLLEIETWGLGWVPNLHGISKIGQIPAALAWHCIRSTESKVVMYWARQPKYNSWIEATWFKRAGNKLVDLGVMEACQSAVPESWMQLVEQKRWGSHLWPCFHVFLAWEHSLYTIFVVLIICVIYEKSEERAQPHFSQSTGMVDLTKWPKACPLIDTSAANCEKLWYSYMFTWCILCPCYLLCMMFCCFHLIHMFSRIWHLFACIYIFICNWNYVIYEHLRLWPSSYGLIN